MTRLIGYPPLIDSTGTIFSGDAYNEGAHLPEIPWGGGSKSYIEVAATGSAMTAENDGLNFWTSQIYSPFPTGGIQNFQLLAGQTGIYYSGGTISWGATYGVGQTICLAYDEVTRNVWFRNGSGYWNASATADPATGYGGININPGQSGATVTSGMSVFLAIAIAGPVFTCKFVPPYTFAAPAGFSGYGLAPTSPHAAYATIIG